MSAPLPPAILALSPGTVVGPGDVERLVLAIGQATQAAPVGVILREPSLADGPFLELAHRVRGVMGEGWLALHDRPHLVASVGADATHLGFRSLPAREARVVVGPGVAVGVSHHAQDPASQLEGADYRTFGPLHETPSKQGHLQPVGTSGLAEAIAQHACPTWALGGVSPQDADGVRAAGGRGLAVLRGVLLAQDPAAAARAHHEAWRRAS